VVARRQAHADQVRHVRGEVRGVNAAGILVGAEYRGLASQRRPVLWRDGEKSILPYPPEFASFFEGVAEAINDDDVAVGHAFHNHNNTVPDSPPSTLPTALRWDGDGVVVLPRPEEATVSRASAINAAGVIAGSVSVGDLDQIAVWDGDQIDLYALPDDLGQVPSFQVRGINAAGLVVATGLADGGFFAFVSDRGEPTRLRGLTEGVDAVASGINDDGTVVGASISSGEGALAVATIWVDGEPGDLNKLMPSGSDLRLTQGIAVSNSGAIAVRGIDGEDMTHGVLLLPVS